VKEVIAIKKANAVKMLKPTSILWSRSSNIQLNCGYLMIE